MDKKHIVFSLAGVVMATSGFRGLFFDTGNQWLTWLICVVGTCLFMYGVGPTAMGFVDPAGYISGSSSNFRPDNRSKEED